MKIFLNKKKEESNNMVVNATKNSQKIKNKNLLSIERNIIGWEKIPIYNYKKNLF